MIAALFVERNGCYFGLPDVDPWDRERDARNYAGPHPVVAHPPCERWGRFWFGGPQWLKDGHPRKKLGDDDGCFAAALAAVRRCGGVLEHPADSHAWRIHGLKNPPRTGQWVSAGDFLRWTCCVSQGNYGHKGDKATWLYAVAPLAALPELTWGKSGKRVLLAGLSKARRERDRRTGIVQALSKRQRAATPIPFRDLLIGIASQAAASEVGRQSRPSGPAVGPSTPSADHRDYRCPQGREDHVESARDRTLSDLPSPLPERRLRAASALTGPVSSLSNFAGAPAAPAIS